MAHTTKNDTLPGIALLLVMALALGAIGYKHLAAPAAGWVNGWREVNSFHYPRRALAATTYNNYLYVLGGVDNQGNYVKPVEYAPILEDGGLGPWRQTSTLLEGRFYLAAASHQGYLYAIGGGGGDLGDNNVPLASVERARIQADGSLGPWRHHSYLTTPRRGLKAAIVGQRLFAIGGYNGTFLKSTESLCLTAADPQWRQEPSQAQVDRYIHAAAQRDNRLYLLGGHTEKSGSSYGDVESAPVDELGQLGPWRIAQTRLQDARFIASAFALGNHLYIVGGHNGIRRLASVEVASTNAQGHVGAWSSLPDLNHKRSATAAAIAGQHVYIAGGMDDNGALRSVEMATYRPGGALAHRMAAQ
jgi:hypothetical protein